MKNKFGDFAIIAKLVIAALITVTALAVGGCAPAYDFGRALADCALTERCVR